MKLAAALEVKKWRNATWSFASHTTSIHVLKYPFHKHISEHEITWNPLPIPFQPPKPFFTHIARKGISSQTCFHPMKILLQLHTYTSIYINPKPLALLHILDFNFTENVWNFIWENSRWNVWNSCTIAPPKSSPSKAAKTDSIFAQEIFFQLLPAGPCFLSNIYYYYVGLARCDCFISFSFLCIVFHEPELGVCLCGLNQRRDEFISCVTISNQKWYYTVILLIFEWSCVRIYKLPSGLNCTGT